MNKTIIKACIIALSFISILSHAQPETFINGTHYRTLEEPLHSAKKDTVEVAGVFWYGCPHCSNLEPVLEKWAATKPDYIDFIHVPAIFSKRWEFHAKAFYTIKALGIEDQAHLAIFDHIHKDREALSNKNQLVRFLSKEFGQKEERVTKTFNSFGVKAKVGAAKTLIRQADLTFVPAVIIAGKYVTSVSQAGTEENLLKVINYLAEKVNKENV